MDIGDVYNVLDSPIKRSKNNDRQWRHSGWLPANTSTASPVARTIANEIIVVESHRKEYTTSDSCHSTPASSAHNLQRVRAVSTDSATVQRQNRWDNGSPQAPDKEGATVHEAVSTQHIVLDTTPITENHAPQLPHTFPEHPATAKSYFPMLLQPQTHTRVDTGPKAITRRQGPTASDAEGIRRHDDVPEDPCNSDYEHQLHYGKLVNDLRKLKGRRERQTQQINAERNALPDIKILAKNVEQKEETIKELTRLLEQARESAMSARGNLEATKNKINDIETAEQEVEQLVVTSIELRSQLGID
jgi:hypothetical protein